MSALYLSKAPVKLGKTLTIHFSLTCSVATFSSHKAIHQQPEEDTPLPGDRGRGTMHYKLALVKCHHACSIKFTNYDVLIRETWTLDRDQAASELVAVIRGDCYGDSNTTCVCRGEGKEGGKREGRGGRDREKREGRGEGRRRGRGGKGGGREKREGREKGGGRDRGRGREKGRGERRVRRVGEEEEEEEGGGRREEERGHAESIDINDIRTSGHT